MASPPGDDASFYETWFEPLCAIAVRGFHIPRHDAEQLVHEVLLTSLVRRFRGMPEAGDGPWLKGAMRLASQHYIETTGRKLR